MAKREERKGGFYWVRIRGIWTVAHWVTFNVMGGGTWLFTGTLLNEADDNEIQEVDERILINPNI